MMNQNTDWLEYEHFQGPLDAEREEQELAAHYDDLARQHGYDQDDCNYDPMELQL